MAQQFEAREERSNRFVTTQYNGDKYPKCVRGLISSNEDLSHALHSESTQERPRFYVPYEYDEDKIKSESSTGIEPATSCLTYYDHSNYSYVSDINLCQDLQSVAMSPDWETEGNIPVCSRNYISDKRYSAQGYSDHVTVK